MAKSKVVTSKYVAPLPPSAPIKVNEYPVSQLRMQKVEFAVAAMSALISSTKGNHTLVNASDIAAKSMMYAEALQVAIMRGEM